VDLNCKPDRLSPTKDMIFKFGGPEHDIFGAVLALEVYKSKKFLILQRDNKNVLTIT
jgi:hypothetical protein